MNDLFFKAQFVTTKRKFFDNITSHASTRRVFTGFTPESVESDMKYAIENFNEDLANSAIFKDIRLSVNNTNDDEHYLIRVELIDDDNTLPRNYRFERILDVLHALVPLTDDGYAYFRKGGFLHKLTFEHD